MAPAVPKKGNQLPAPAQAAPVAAGLPPEAVAAIQALAKLQMMNRVANLEDLRVPPGNRLEALRGDRAGQHSIRINQQWRVCFCWTPEGPAAVEIADYH